MRPRINLIGDSTFDPPLSLVERAGHNFRDIVETIITSAKSFIYRKTLAYTSSDSFAKLVTDASSLSTSCVLSTFSGGYSRDPVD